MDERIKNVGESLGKLPRDAFRQTFDTSHGAKEKDLKFKEHRIGLPA